MLCINTPGLASMSRKSYQLKKFTCTADVPRGSASVFIILYSTLTRSQCTFG